MHVQGRPTLTQLRAGVQTKGFRSALKPWRWIITKSYLFFFEPQQSAERYRRYSVGSQVRRWAGKVGRGPRIQRRWGTPYIVHNGFRHRLRLDRLHDSSCLFLVGRTTSGEVVEFSVLRLVRVDIIFFCDNNTTLERVDCTVSWPNTFAHWEQVYLVYTSKTNCCKTDCPTWNADLRNLSPFFWPSRFYSAKQKNENDTRSSIIQIIYVGLIFPWANFILCWRIIYVSDHYDPNIRINLKTHTSYFRVYFH